MEKTNAEHLKDLIQGNHPEALEFIEAMEGEIAELLKEKLELVQKVDTQGGEIFDMQEQIDGMVHESDLITIHTGIGKIKYLQPENMKCQTYMENLKNQLERDGI